MRNFIKFNSTKQIRNYLNCSGAIAKMFFNLKFYKF